MDEQGGAGKLIAAAVALVVAIPMIIALAFMGSEPDCADPTTAPGADALSPGAKVSPMKPGTYQLTSPFGPRGGTMHQGQDFGSTAGQPIYAAADGTVIKAGEATGFGQWIVLDHKVGGEAVSTVYGHMFPEGVLVKEGDKVTAGQHIADVGYNGEVDPAGPGGAHLHFEVWDGGRFGGSAIDPESWLAGAVEPGQPATDPSADPSSTRGPPAHEAPPTPADPSVVSVADWEKVASLESGGDWAIDTGNGYQGGLQFNPGTWTGHGGGEFAPTANKATPGQQMEVANRVLSGQGWNAWPVTSKEAGVTAKKPAPEGTFLTGATGAPKVELAAAPAPGDSGGAGAECAPEGGGGANTLKPGSVPPEFEPWIRKAAQTCPEVTGPLIAAQLENESNFDVNAHNASSNADGPTQFVPDTWEAKAVDGDGDGRRDTRNIADAVMSQAAYDCELAQIAKDDLQKGALHGDLTELWLSMYNCGPGATQSQGQVCQNSETLAYVRNIPANAASKFSAPNPGGSGDLALSGPFGKKAVDAAMKWRGTTYAWGGGNAHGPSQGVTDGGVADSFGDFNKNGFDCSGLMIYAIAQASDQKIVLDHYTVNQLNDPRGQPVPADALAPGDVVFPGGGNPQHVAMYIGGGQIVEAPQSGDVVKVSPLSNLGSGIDARRFG